MSSPSFPAPAVACSGQSCSGSEPSATSSATPTVKRFSRRASETAYLIVPRSSETFERFSETDGPTAIEAWLTWSRQAFPVSRSASPANAEPTPTSETFGRKPPNAFAEFDPASRSWKTCQGSLLTLTSERYSETWPRSGSMRSGWCSERTTPAPRIGGSGFGFLPTPTATSYGTQQGGSAGRVGPVRESLETMARRGTWPTPTVGDSKASGSAGYSTESGRHSGTTLTDAAVRWPTPRSTDGSHGGRVTPQKGREGGTIIEAVSARTWATPSTRDWKDTPGMARTGTNPDGTERSREDQLARQVFAGGTTTQPTKGLSLNPSWVEWLMGWPIGWTDCAPLAMDRVRQWWRSHGKNW